MRPRLSRPSAFGDDGLEVFALGKFLGAVLLLCIVLLPYERVRAILPLLGQIGELRVHEAMAAAYVIVRLGSLRRPFAEWGWSGGRGILREGAIGVAVGMVMWLVRNLPHAVPEPDSMGRLVEYPVVALSVLVLAPVFEETLYRGMLYRYLRDRMRWPLATIACAAIFGAMHLPPRLTSAFVTGLVYTLLREWRGSLIAPIAAHASWNLLSMTAHMAALD